MQIQQVDWWGTKMHVVQDLQQALQLIQQHRAPAPSSSTALAIRRDDAIPVPANNMRLIAENLQRVRSSAAHARRCLDEMSLQLSHEVSTCDDCISLVKNLARECGHQI